jgi:very-short-patch-repair endonuclease
MNDHPEDSGHDERETPIVRNKLLESRAHVLRHQSTDAEHLLWQFLKNSQRRGMKFRRQYVVGRYILDFYCVQRKLAVEVDGGVHAEPAQQVYDMERTRFLTGYGSCVLRFWNSEVFQSIEEVVRVIDAALDTGAPPTAARGTPRRGGGR